MAIELAAAAGHVNVVRWLASHGAPHGRAMALAAVSRLMLGYFVFTSTAGCRFVWRCSFFVGRRRRCRCAHWWSVWISSVGSRSGSFGRSTPCVCVALRSQKGNQEEAKFRSLILSASQQTGFDHVGCSPSIDFWCHRTSWLATAINIVACIVSSGNRTRSFHCCIA